MKTHAALVRLLVVLGCFLVTSNVLAYYNPATGRFLSRDPSGELGGTNLYAMVGNNAINHLDYVGLWKIDRKSKWKHAVATAATGDTIRTLAKKIKLDENQFTKWAVDAQTDRHVDDEYPVGCTVRVPNLVFVTIGQRAKSGLQGALDGAAGAYPSIFTVMSIYDRSVIKASLWGMAHRQAGYRVEYVHLTSPREFESKLQNSALAHFLYAGHGKRGQLTPTGTDGVTVTARNYRHVTYTIASLILITCEGSYQGAGSSEEIFSRTNPSYRNGWSPNVSPLGEFISYDGDLGVFNEDDYSAYPGSTAAPP